MTIRSFVLRQGRLTAAQERAFKELWPKYGIDVADDNAQIDVATLFSEEKPLVLEIGFGNGESLIKMAADAPELAFIGLEVHSPGVGHALMKIEEHGLKNLKLIRADAVDILTSHIRDNSLQRVQIYFSDPWPKARHHKRRLIQKPFTDLVHKKLVAGGELHCATDWEHYAYWMRDVFEKDQDKWQNLGNDDGFSDKPEWRPMTKFEERGIRKGHQVWDLRYIAQSE